MARDMASLLSQPSQATPPDAGPEQSQGTQQSPGSLQQLMQDNPGAQMQQGADGKPAPNFEMTMAALRQMQMFSREWEKLLKLDEIGKADIKGPFVEAAARLMGEELITLPQTLQMMKTFPDNPLQQRQWVQEHYARDQQAQIMIKMQHVAAFPGQSHQPPPETSGGRGHLGLVTDLVSHYKKFGKGKKNA